MTNLIIPTASAVSGIPENTNMADVIDSLKRLERVGDEYSKTTQKLIDAAGQLSSLIVKMYSPRGKEKIEVRIEYEPQKRFVAGRETAFPDSEWYTVEASGVYRVDSAIEYVAANRDAALRFSRSVAKGLIDRIVRDLEVRNEESQKGSDVLEDAAKGIEKEPPTSHPLQRRRSPLP